MIEHHPILCKSLFVECESLCFKNHLFCLFHQDVDAIITYCIFTLHNVYSEMVLFYFIMCQVCVLAAAGPGSAISPTPEFLQQLSAGGRPPPLLPESPNTAALYSKVYRVSGCRGR